MNKLRLLALGIQSSIALLLSLVITLVNFGLAQGFFLDWAKGFVVAFLVIPSLFGSCPGYRWSPAGY